LVPKDSKIIVCVGFGKCPNGKRGGGRAGREGGCPTPLPPTEEIQIKNRVLNQVGNK